MAHYGVLAALPIERGAVVKNFSAIFVRFSRNGGLALTQSELGLVNGTFGLIALILGGILGGIFIAKKGLRKSLIIMILALNLPDIFYAYMAALQTENFAAVSSMVFIEQFGYGFGFTAYTVFMMQISRGANSSSHYAVCTAFMAAGMMLPGMVSGWLQNMMGYTTFFIWVTVCALPSLFIALYMRKNNKILDQEDA